MQASKDIVVEGAKLVEKTVSMTKFEIIEYQLMHYCYIHSIQINHTELRLLALLGWETGKLKEGMMRVTDFCLLAVKNKILSSPQAVNTALYKLQRTNLFFKEGIGKKLIFLNPGVGIINKGNVVIKLMLFNVESNKTDRAVQKAGRKPELAGGVH